MKKYIVIIGRVIAGVIVLCLLYGAFIQYFTVEKLYTCVGDTTSTHFGHSEPNSNGVSVYRDNIGFSYKVIPFGRIEIDGQRAHFNRDDDVYVNDTHVYGNATEYGSISILKFDRITKKIEMSVRYSNWNLDFVGQCTPTTRG